MRRSSFHAFCAVGLCVMTGMNGAVFVVTGEPWSGFWTVFCALGAWLNGHVAKGFAERGQ